MDAKLALRNAHQPQADKLIDLELLAFAFILFESEFFRVFRGSPLPVFRNLNPFFSPSHVHFFDCFAGLDRRISRF